MNAITKTAAAMAMMAFSAPAFAGGVNVYDDGESKLKLEALLYLNTFKNTDTRTTAGTAVKTRTTGMNIDRAYFTAKYSFNSDWMMRITTDVGKEASLGKKQNIYLKYAYVEGKLAGDAVVLRLGQSHTPWIDYEQGKWKHRYVAKVMSDTYKFDTSADLGLGLKGKLADGLVDYFVTATNGTGYGGGNPSTGADSIDYNSRVGIHPVKGLDIDFQYANGYKATRTFISGVATQGINSKLIQAMASYGTHDFRVGFNYLQNTDKAKSATASSTHGGNASSAYATAAAGDQVKSSGMALWAWANVPDTKFGAFGRYESLKNQFITGGVANVTKEKVTRYVAGLEYSPIKNVSLSLVFDQTKLSNRGGVTTTSDKDNRFGIYSQVKL